MAGVVADESAGLATGIFRPNMAPQTVAGRPNPRPKGAAGLGAAATKADSVGQAATTSAPSYSTCWWRRSGRCMTTRPLRRRFPIRYRKIHERGCLVRSRSRLGSHSLLGSFLAHAVLWIGRSVPTQRCGAATNPPLPCNNIDAVAVLFFPPSSLSTTPAASMSTQLLELGNRLPPARRIMAALKDTLVENTRGVLDPMYGLSPRVSAGGQISLASAVVPICALAGVGHCSVHDRC